MAGESMTARALKSLGLDPAAALEQVENLGKNNAAIAENTAQIARDLGLIGQHLQALHQAHAAMAAALSEIRAQSAQQLAQAAEQHHGMLRVEAALRRLEQADARGPTPGGEPAHVTTNGRGAT